VERPSGGTAQGLALTAEVGKTLFFEDEPIFLLLRLTNVGSDTAWVMDFAAISMAVQMSLRRDGEPVPVGGLWIDYVCPRSGYRCGKPLAPGKSQLTAGILQDRAGDQKDFKRRLLRGHLGPGEYELRVSTHGAEAAPIAFHVRERSATEAKDLKELEAIQSMMRTSPLRPMRVRRSHGWRDTHRMTRSCPSFWLSGCTSRARWKGSTSTVSALR